MAQNKVQEFWVPDGAKKETAETNMPKAPDLKANGKPPKPKKAPKVKELAEEKNGKKNTTTAPPSSGAISAFINVLTTVSGRIGGVVAKGKAKIFRPNKVAPIQSKVQPRHLELEPLCCLSSCLVRGGCACVVAFEAFYVAATLLIAVNALSRHGFKLWSPVPNSVNLWFAHELFYYCICIYDIFLLAFLIGLARGLIIFSKDLVRAHYYFCFFSLIVNIAFFAFSLWALCSPGPIKWTAINCLLVFCFAMQIPLQIWGLTVVKSCQDFFALIQVFVALAEA